MSSLVEGVDVGIELPQRVLGDHSGLRDDPVGEQGPLHVVRVAGEASAAFALPAPG